MQAKSLIAVNIEVLRESMFDSTKFRNLISG